MTKKEEKFNDEHMAAFNKILKESQVTLINRMGGYQYYNVRMEKSDGAYYFVLTDQIRNDQAERENMVITGKEIHSSINSWITSFYWTEVEKHTSYKFWEALFYVTIVLAVLMLFVGLPILLPVVSMIVAAIVVSSLVVGCGVFLPIVGFLGNPLFLDPYMKKHPELQAEILSFPVRYEPSAKKESTEHDALTSVAPVTTKNTSTQPQPVREGSSVKKTPDSTLKKSLK